MRRKKISLAMMALLFSTPGFSMIENPDPNPDAGTELQALSPVTMTIGAQAPEPAVAAETRIDIPAAVAVPAMPAPEASNDVPHQLSHIQNSLATQSSRLNNIGTHVDQLMRNQDTFRRQTSLRWNLEDRRYCFVTSILLISFSAISYVLSTRTSGLADAIAEVNNNVLNLAKTTAVTRPAFTPAPTPKPTSNSCANQCDFLRTMDNLSHEGYWIPYRGNNSIRFEFMNCTYPTLKPTTAIAVNMTMNNMTMPVQLNMTDEHIVTSISPASTSSGAFLPNVTMQADASLHSTNTTLSDHVFHLRMIDGFPICDAVNDMPALVNATDAQ